MGRSRWIFLGAAAACLVPVGASQASAAGSTSQARHAATVLARRELVGLRQVGRGWNIDAPPPAGTGPLTCGRYHPSVATPLGSAGSAVFSQTSTGPFLSEAVWVYASEAQARTVWHRVARRGFRRCAADGLAAGSSNGVTFTVSRSRMLRSLPAGAANARYRVSGSAATSGQTTPVYLDEVLLRSGRSISALSLSSFTVPPRRALELRLGRAAVRRLNNP